MATARSRLPTSPVEVGAWPAVLSVTAAAAAVTWAVHDRRT